MDFQRIVRASCSILLGAVALAPLAHADDDGTCRIRDRYGEAVMTQAAAAAVMLGERGYRPVDVSCGALKEGEAHWLDVTVAPEGRVALAAFCDQDCTDVDLRLFRGSRAVARDTLSDDVPVVEIQGTGRTVRYRLEVDMFRCSVEPCRFGVALYQK
jgi:hypothetical protein